jgi:hypothetical protein
MGSIQLCPQVAFDLTDFKDGVFYDLAHKLFILWQNGTFYFVPQNLKTDRINGTVNVSGIPSVQVEELKGTPYGAGTSLAPATVKDARLSLDGAMVAIQKNQHEVEVVLLSKGIPPAGHHQTRSPTTTMTPPNGAIRPISVMKHWRVFRKSKSPLLKGGIIWSEHNGDSQDLCLVTTKGSFRNVCAVPTPIDDYT